MSQRPSHNTRQSERTRRAHQPASGMTFPRGAGAYPQDLTPVALVDDYVRLLPQDEVRQVRALVSQPGVLAFDSSQGNDFTVTGNSTETDRDPNELDMPDGWLAQFRLLAPGQDIDDDIVMTVDQGGSQAQMYTTRNAQGQIDNETGTQIGYDGSNQVTGDTISTAFTEFYVWEDTPPQLTFENTTAGDVTIDDLRFTGYQYRLTEPVSLPEDTVPVTLPVERVRGTQF